MTLPICAKKPCIYMISSKHVLRLRLSREYDCSIYHTCKHYCKRNLDQNSAIWALHYLRALVTQAWQY